MENFVLFSNEKRKNTHFSRINLFLGYSGSGKTMLLEDLANIFSGKNKNYLINSIPVKTDDFNILKISSFEDISTHLKLNAKSFIKRFYMNSSFSEEFHKMCEVTLQSIGNIVAELSQKLSCIIPNSEMNFSYDNLLDMILDNCSISTKDEYHSFYKKALFNLISELSKQTNKKTLVFIDDFDSSIDEEGILSLFESMKNAEAYFFLTSSKPLPQQLLSETISLFAIRNNQMIPMPDIHHLISSSLEEQPMYSSFEEYMLSKGFIENSGIVNSYIQKIQEDQCANLMRILTTRNPIITNEFFPGKICIIPNQKRKKRSI